jgi:hypothetical protein
MLFLAVKKNFVRRQTYLPRVVPLIEVGGGTE